MMFGFRDKFVYLECLECGCLQISQIPTDMAKYYPVGYYSFSAAHPEKNRRNSRAKEWLQKRRDNFVVFKKSLLGRMINWIYPNKYFKSHFSGLNDVFTFTQDSRILDVGCGNGSFLRCVRAWGVTNCLGVDPYIEEDIDYPDGAKVIRGTISDLDQEFDLITFHHSFEHIADPIETLKSVHRLLSKKGICLIRIPTVSSYAWEHYRENWVQLDAPRHFFLYSVQSIHLLAKKAKLKLLKVVYDSGVSQFADSEQYLRDIPMVSDKSHSKKNPLFTKKQMRAFKKKARQLNSSNQGDQAAFYLQKN